jgi:hypothetical protein
MPDVPDVQLNPSKITSRYQPEMHSINSTEKPGQVGKPTSQKWANCNVKRTWITTTKK